MNHEGAVYIRSLFLFAAFAIVLRAVIFCDIGLIAAVPVAQLPAGFHTVVRGMEIPDRV